MKLSALVAHTLRQNHENKIKHTTILIKQLEKQINNLVCQVT